MAAALGQEVGSKACGACHAAIYRSYSATGMSQSSGKAGAVQFRESFDRADFTDAVSGVEYRVSPSPDGYRLQFTRGDSDVRVLAWFIGSGRVGRSYLSSLDGFLFQSLGVLLF